MSSLSQFFSDSTNNQLIPIEVFAVGGGGGGGGGITAGVFQGAGGGGGAGQVQYVRTFVNKKVSYPITIGAGGAGGNFASESNAPGSPGSNTIFNNIISYGGGGATRNINGSGAIFTLGSTGGGNSSPSSLYNIAASPLATSNYSVSGYIFTNKGGNGHTVWPSGGGGGGGGARTAGSNVGTPTSLGGPGGNGVPAEAFGNILDVGGGGGGGLGSGNTPTAPGGIGGGGQGGGIGGNGSNNTGGGGGGGGTPSVAPSNGIGGNGGSGILVIRYPTAFAAATVTGNTATPAQSGYHVYRWNSGPATITFN